MGRFRNAEGTKNNDRGRGNEQRGDRGLSGILRCNLLDFLLPSATMGQWWGGFCCVASYARTWKGEEGLVEAVVK